MTDWQFDAQTGKWAVGPSRVTIARYARLAEKSPTPMQERIDRVKAWARLVKADRKRLKHDTK